MASSQSGNAATAAASSLHGAKDPQDDAGDTDSDKPSDEKKPSDPSPSPTPDPAVGPDSKDAIKANLQADIETEGKE